jgi:hypothetical protein
MEIYTVLLLHMAKKKSCYSDLFFFLQNCFNSFIAIDEVYVVRILCDIRKLLCECLFRRSVVTNHHFIFHSTILESQKDANEYI